MKCCSVLDRCGSYLVPDPGISPDVFAVSPYLTFIFSLSYECEAPTLIVAFDNLRDRPELAYFAAPSGFNSGGTEIIDRLPE